MLTESPARLDQCDLRVVDEVRDGALQVVGLRLEVGVEDDHVLALAHVRVLHPRAQRAGLVTLAVVTDLVRDVDALARPTLALHTDHFL
ncbi:hypothetical protein PR202_gb06501 [Eleusine coracana subsp. coracana]|uniref:Uncharacterized protein n=1 Tax=Eleusine coracana subsp. coracana TaxID=191504 RepID=A0AAV5E9R9_ELECO|nr:hypothetical protein PR202_gb06501 [Eleusine coracana subsp. coracana]